MNKTLPVLFVLFASFWIPVQAQSRAQWHFLVAPGVGNVSAFGINGRATIHLLGGGEEFIYHGLSAGAEVGPLMSWSAPGGGSTFTGDHLGGIGSANLAYHFLGRKLEPIITTGYTFFVGHLFFPNGGNSSGYNVGGGGNVWISENAAIRFDVRYHHSFQQKVMEIGMGMSFK
jgi:hypothetical protein